MHYRCTFTDFLTKYFEVSLNDLVTFCCLCCPLIIYDFICYFSVDTASLMLCVNLTLPSNLNSIFAAGKEKPVESGMCLRVSFQIR